VDELLLLLSQRHISKNTEITCYPKYPEDNSCDSIDSNIGFYVSVAGGGDTLHIDSATLDSHSTGHFIGPDAGGCGKKKMGSLASGTTIPVLRSTGGARRDFRGNGKYRTLTANKLLLAHYDCVEKS
jgi:hypothetical protein